VEVARETLGGVGGRPDGVLWRVEKIRKINTEKIRKKVEKKIKEKKEKRTLWTLHSLIHLTQPGEVVLPNIFLKRLQLH
jgi:hypothetical protein